MSRLIRKFIELNRRASRYLNSFLPVSVTQDGNVFFLNEILPYAFAPGQVVFDIGGGAQPYVDTKLKQRFGLRTTGIDISREELEAAPPGTYDEIVVADISTLRLQSEADVVICQATLEHLADTEGAVKAIADLMQPGAKAYFFAPSRNAVFARINLLLPQRLKEKLLYTVSPEVEDHQGFPARYDKCTPREIEKLFNDCELEIVERHLFWMSSYFMILTPVFVLWRLWQGAFWIFSHENAAETFIYIVRKAS